MLMQAMLVLEIQRTNPRIGDAVAEHYASWVVEEADAHEEDPWLIFALGYVESRWTARVVRHEGDGSCSVGIGQINVPTCEARAVERLRDPRENLRQVGTRLELLRRTCKKDCMGIGWLRGYNPGDRGYVARVEKVLRRCHEEHDDHQPVVREVPTGLHLPGMCG